MFYSQYILAKKGALGKVWLAAHWDKKLTKQAINQTDLEDTVKNIVEPTTPIALRTSGHLLLGVVRIYSRKTQYLWIDASDALVKIKTATKPGGEKLKLSSVRGSKNAESDNTLLEGGSTNVDLPTKESAVNTITLADNFNDIDIDVPDMATIAMTTANDEHIMMNIARHEDITMLDGDFNIYRNKAVMGMDANRDSFGGFMAHNDISIEVGRDAGPDISFRPSDFSEINVKDGAMEVDMSLERNRGIPATAAGLIDEDDFGGNGLEGEDAFGVSEVFNDNMDMDGMAHDDNNLEISNIEIPDMMDNDHQQYGDESNESRTMDDSNLGLQQVPTNDMEALGMGTTLRPMNDGATDEQTVKARHAQKQQALAKKMKRKYFDVDIEISPDEYKKQLQNTSDLTNRDSSSMDHPLSKKSKVDFGFLFSRPSTQGMPSQLYYLFNRDVSTLPVNTDKDAANCSNDISMPDISEVGGDITLGEMEMDLPTVNEDQIEYPDYQANDEYEHEHNNPDDFDFGLSQSTQETSEATNLSAGPDDTTSENIATNNVGSERTVRMLNSLNQTFESKNTTKLSLNAILHGKSKRTAAACFFEILTLKTRNEIDIKQNAPFGDIMVFKNDLENTAVATTEAHQSA